MDKEEITAEALRIGTYPISIVPDEDCCQVFTPKHPVTRARLADIDGAERTLPMDELVQAAASATAVEEFHFPAATPSSAGRPEPSGVENLPRGA
jgi:thiamine biosynthesis protein ThiI